MSRVRLTVELEVTNNTRPQFVFCKLPNGQEWAVPREIFDDHCYPIQEDDLGDLFCQEFNLEPTEKLYLVVNPKSEEWTQNKDWIKAHGGVYVPQKKCWILCWDGYDLDDYDLARHTSVFGKLMLTHIPIGDDLYHLVKDISTGRYAQPIQ